MTWTPISGSVPQYQAADGTLASGYYLKFYSAGTTSPLSMATDSTGGTTLAKAQINTAGYPINGSGDVFIPHISQSYKIVLYKNATDADNDTTGNADWVIDNISQSAAATPTQVINIEYQLGSQASGQVFTLAGFTYALGVNNLLVYRNGNLLRQGVSHDYEETSASSVTINSSITIASTDQFAFVKGTSTTSTISDAASVTYTPAGVGAVSTNVQDYLRSETLESYSGRFIAGTGSAAARPLAGVHINKDATVHANYGLIDETAYNFTSGGTIGSATINDNTTTTGTVNIDHHYSFQSRPKINTSSGTLSSLTGLNALFDLQGGAVNVATAVSYVNPTKTTGTVNYNWGINIDNLTAGTLENIGVYIAGASGGSAKNYSIYCASATAPIHLGGKLDIAFGGTKKADLGWDDTTGSIMLDNISTSAKLNIDTFETRFTNGQAFIGVGTPDATTLDAQLHVKGPNDKVALFLENNHPTDPSEWFISTSEKTVALGGLSFYDNLAAAVRLYITTAGVVRPGGDGTQDLGDATHRWQTVYATTGTINTSDEREKEFLEIEDAEISAAKELKTAIRKYRFKNDDKKRFGIGAQTVEKIMAKHGLNADDYGFFSCVDDRYGINYSELLCFLSLA